MIVLVELFNKESTSDKQDLLKFELFKALSSCDIKPRETFKKKFKIILLTNLLHKTVIKLYRNWDNKYKRSGISR